MGRVGLTTCGIAIARGFNGLAVRLPAKNTGNVGMAPSNEAAPCAPAGMGPGGGGGGGGSG